MLKEFTRLAAKLSRAVTPLSHSGREVQIREAACAPQQRGNDGAVTCIQRTLEDKHHSKGSRLKDVRRPLTHDLASRDLDPTQQDPRLAIAQLTDPGDRRYPGLGLAVKRLLDADGPDPRWVRLCADRKLVEQ